MMQKNGKTFPALRLEEKNIVKMSILLKRICIFNAIPIKIPTAFFMELEQTMETMWFQDLYGPQKTLNSQGNLEKERQSWRHHISGLQVTLQAVVIKTVWYWHKNRCLDQ